MEDRWERKAIRAKAIRVQDRIVIDYGFTAEVTVVHQINGERLEVGVRSRGLDYTRRYRPNSAVIILRRV